MNKADLADRVATKTSLSRTGADDAVSALLSTIADALASSDTVRIGGFGSFFTRSRSARRGRYVRVGERFAIAASITPSFKAG